MKIVDIKKDLQKKLSKTITEISNDAMMIMTEELDDFYAYGSPVYYQRTGILGGSPEIKGMYCIGTTAGLTAGLNKGISYNTGGFTGEQVIDAAEHGTSGIVGRPGFWKRSEYRIEKAVDDAVERNF